MTDRVNAYTQRATKPKGENTKTTHPPDKNTVTRSDQRLTAAQRQSRSCQRTSNRRLFVPFLSHLQQPASEIKLHLQTLIHTDVYTANTLGTKSQRADGVCTSRATLFILSLSLRPPGSLSADRLRMGPGESVRERKGEMWVVKVGHMLREERE